MNAMSDSSDARANILTKVRRSLSQSGGSSDREAERQAVATRLEAKERGILPQRSQVGKYEQIALFMDYAEKVSASTDRISDYKDLPAAIAGYLRERNLPQRLVMGEDKRLGQVDWSVEPNLERTIGPSDGTDLVGLSHAIGGVAETGTALFTSGPENPTTINFLPETHIIVVKADDIAADYETVQDRLRGPDGEAQMPRVVNMITGPSRSGDIEQTILLGAHGPRDVHVIVVG